MIQYLWRKRVYCDGRHNSWPHIAYFKGKYFISFSNQDSHFHRKRAKALIVSSEDGIDWSEPTQIQYKDWPISDVSSLFVWEDRLFVEMHGHPTEEERITLVATSADGEEWSEPTPIEPGISVWHVKEKDGVLYRASFDVGDERLFLWKSEDGFKWEKVSLINGDLFSEESEIHFLGDGRLLGVARTKGGGDEPPGGAPGFMFISEPPYQEWEIIGANTTIHAPALCEVGGELILAGREVLSSFEIIYSARSSLWSWNGDGFTKELDLHQGPTKKIGWVGRAMKTHWEGFPEDFIRILDGSYMGIQPVAGRPDEALVCDYWGTTSEADIWVTAIKVGGGE